jgi:hypothetical protein
MPFFLILVCASSGSSQVNQLEGIPDDWREYQKSAPRPTSSFTDTGRPILVCHEKYPTALLRSAYLLNALASNRAHTARDRHALNVCNFTQTHMQHEEGIHRNIRSVCFKLAHVLHQHQCAALQSFRAIHGEPTRSIAASAGSVCVDLWSARFSRMKHVS